MTVLEVLSNRISQYFGSTANFYVKQVGDGSYRKTPGRVTGHLVKEIIETKQSIACYQRNIDHTINWICFDFDILKSKINTADEGISEKHLIDVVRSFVGYLNSKQISHLVEFSGNRGIHVWINFQAPIFPHTAYELVKKLIDGAELSINRNLIGLDLFPSSASHKSAFGKAVKIPLSKHAKSGCYSILVEKIPSNFESVRLTQITEEILLSQSELLSAHQTESIHLLEHKLDCVLDYQEMDELSTEYVRIVEVSALTITFDQILEFWSKLPLMATIVEDIQKGSLNHARRQLLVGLLNPVVNPRGEKIGRKLLLDIFARMTNFDLSKTESGLTKLASLPFPSQEVVESICNFTLPEKYPSNELVELLVPYFVKVENDLFNINDKDFRVSKIAERHYLYQNDEVRCIRVLDELAALERNAVKEDFDRIVSGDAPIELYRHYRKEKGKEKERELITLGALPRLFSTWATKYFTYFFDHSSSENSFGYKINKNFAGGHIFKPWLYQWIEFLHNVGDFLNNELNGGFFVVKTDIKSFYDSIPQDNLERLLLRGFNDQIAEKISKLQPPALIRYQEVCKSLMRITRACNSDRRGVPQGPAYARYLSELYLDKIDKLMDGLMAKGDIIFYHRYVDDIFFVAESRANAEECLTSFRNNLELLGLNLNQEKTLISQISDFGEEFDKYRAQAKYAIDAISKNIDEATDFEKNVALLEYNKLISQQDDNDDAVFLFSHLPGLPRADTYRDQSVLPIIQNAIGRGNLFRHVFMHVLSTESLWGKFSEIQQFSDLQSEVFTSVCVEVFSDQRDVASELNIFIASQLTKLTITPLVSEHLAYLKLYFSIGSNDFGIDAPNILRCAAAAEEQERIQVNMKLIDIIQSELNGVGDIGVLSEYLYPLCIRAQADAESLDSLAKIFVSKLSEDETSGRLTVDKCGEKIKNASTANKYYQILCLFTLSKAFSGRQLLERAWEFCSSVLEWKEDPTVNFKKMSWYRNFDLVDINKTNLNIVVSSISEGTLWSGRIDKLGSYSHYHNALMIKLLTGDRREQLEDLKAAISTLSGISEFYRWILGERDQVRLFPSKNWFIENVAKNDCILLARNNSVLIRKPSDAFITADAKEDKHVSALLGYSDHVIAYRSGDHRSIFRILSNSAEFFDVLSQISNILTGVETAKSSLPNFFAVESLVHAEDIKAFSEELTGLPYLIFEKDNKVNSRKSSFQNFLECLFLVVQGNRSTAFSGANSPTLWDFYVACVSTLNAETEVVSFLRRVVVLSVGNKTSSNEVVFNLIVANALYGAGVDVELSGSLFYKIRKFLDQYNKITKSSSQRHLYKVSTDIPVKKNLKMFAESIIRPIEAAFHYRPDLRFDLTADLRGYFESVLDMALDISSGVTLDDFNAFAVRLNVITETISVDGESYSFENIVVINPVNGISQSFLQEHIFLLQSSEDIFGFKEGSKAFLFFAPRELTLAFSDVHARQPVFFKDGNPNPTHDFPYQDFGNLIDGIDLNRASDVVAIHRNIPSQESDKILRDWLAYIPMAARKPLVLLIQAHEAMPDDRIRELCAEFDSAAKASRNPFLLKPFADFGGIHRVLAVSAERARKLDAYGPSSIRDGSTIASLFLDLTISGSQVASALEYYMSATVVEIDKKYFAQNEEVRVAIGNKLRSLSCLHLHTIFYTSGSIEKIKSTLAKYNISTRLDVHGINISDNAYFESTRLISQNDKKEIMEFFSNKELIDQLANVVFNMDGKTRKGLRGKLANSGKINLVTRRNSMTKKCLDFLTADFKGIPRSSIFERIRESNEIKV
jgi:hypothetical protein